MPSPQIPDSLKSDVPPSAFGKILAATPVVMTVIATLLAGLASSEMTRAQYDRSLAAQQQSKAGDQWSYFQAKRLRSALQHNTLDIVQAAGEVRPLDASALKQAAAQMPPEAAGAKTELLTLLDSAPGQQALAVLQKGEAPDLPAAPDLDPKIQSAIDAIANGRPDTQTESQIAPLNAGGLDQALRAAHDRARAFDDANKPMSQMIDRLDKLLASSPASGNGRSIRRDFTVMRLRHAAQRYDAEARLNQAIGNLFEVQVRLSNSTAEHHRVRSQRFFYGMLIAQAAVIVSTLAMAARQRNVLWSLAATAGVIAIVFAIYVYLWV